MKKSYERPDMHIYRLNSEDIITLSGAGVKKGGLETGKYKSINDGKNVIEF